MACEKFFYQALRDNGFRLTPQREVMLDVLHQFKGPVCAEEIHQEVKKHMQSMDLVTIYRNLELMQKFGLVSLIETNGRQRLYEFVGVERPHLHLICRGCGKIIPADLEVADPIVSALRQQYNFHVEASEINIPGLCEACQAEGRLPHISRDREA